MKKILTMFCICFGVMYHPNKYIVIPTDSLNVTGYDKKSINYPNPLSSSTTILYKIRTPGYVTITIFDLIGREVFWCNEGFRSIGEFKIAINLEFLNSGVYFYEIKVDGRRQAFDRLMLIK